MRDLFAGDFVRRADRRRPHAPADRQLPEEDVAAHGRARPPLSRQGAALRGLRRRRGDPLDARRAASTSRPAAISSSTTRRRSPSSTSTRAASSARAAKRRRGRLEDTIIEEQPRGGEGGRPPAPPARHRRDHRHRLHRHGEPEEPRDGRGSAAQRARARPDEDLRRRDLAARARRDDAPERHRRPAGDPHDASARSATATGSSSPRRPHALEIERKLRAIATPGSRVQAFKVARAPACRSRSWSAPGGARLDELEAVARRRFFLVPAARTAMSISTTSRSSQQGKLEALSPSAPVEEGADARAEARRGRPPRPDRRRRQARRRTRSWSRERPSSSARRCRSSVGRVLDGVAFATLADDAAERRRRSRSRRKPRSRRARRAEGRPGEEPRAEAAPRTTSRSRSSSTSRRSSRLAELRSSDDEPEAGAVGGALPRQGAGAEEEADPSRNARRRGPQEAGGRRGYC